MKKVFIIILIVFFNLSVSAQDSTSNPRLFFRPYFENGINFVRNDFLKQSYGTQSMYYWGFGIQFGHPYNQKVIPYIQFTNSSFEIQKEIAPNITADSLLQNNQITAGLMVPIKNISDVYIRSKLGYSYSLIKESFNKIDSGSHGFQIGIGAEKRIFGYSRIYLDFIYNFQKLEKSRFRDFDMTKLSIGFIL